MCRYVEGWFKSQDPKGYREDSPEAIRRQTEYTDLHFQASELIIPEQIKKIGDAASIQMQERHSWVKSKEGIIRVVPEMKEIDLSGKEVWGVRYYFELEHEKMEFEAMFLGKGGVLNLNVAREGDSVRVKHFGKELTCIDMSPRCPSMYFAGMHSKLPTKTLENEDLLCEWISTQMSILSKFHDTPLTRFVKVI